jgi:hypothetical protein
MSVVARMPTALRLVALLPMVGCEKVSWPSQHYIDSLRVLGVQAQPASLSPGKSARLSLGCADGGRGAEEEPVCDVEVAWFADCSNPDQNDPSKCFGRYAAWPDQIAAPVSDTSSTSFPDGFGFGTTFELTAPDDILSQEADVGKNVVHYGTSYVYFAVCAGQLFPVKGVENRLPIECRERNSGKLLDQRRFVVGITTLYSYDLITNNNPELSAPRFDTVPIPASCAAVAHCPSGFECSTDGTCVPVVESCSRNHPTGCGPHCLDFELDLASFSLFGVDGTMLTEPQKSLWLDGFTNSGKILDDARFSLESPSDASTPEVTRCVNWQAPPTPTEHAHLWIVVRDNRGGIALWDQRVIVR